MQSDSWQRLDGLPHHRQPDIKRQQQLELDGPAHFTHHPSLRQLRTEFIQNAFENVKMKRELFQVEIRLDILFIDRAVKESSGNKPICCKGPDSIESSKAKKLP